MPFLFLASATLLATAAWLLWRFVLGPGKLLQNLVRVIADLRGKFWPDLGPEIADLRLQSGHLGANCVHL